MAKQSTKRRHPVSHSSGKPRLPRSGDSVERLERRVLFAGTWTALTNAAPGAVGTMELLPNGDVIAPTDGDGAGNDWAILTPNSTGSYVGGTWSVAAKANSTRLFDSSDVLQTGSLFVAGGEYGSGFYTGEVYNPITNAWTLAPTQSNGFDDSLSGLIANGDVLITPVAPVTGGGTLLFNASSNSWTAGPKLVYGNSADEQSWVKLPDGSVLTVGAVQSGQSGSSSERYIPAQNKWIADATLPVNETDGLGEYGAGTLLPNGTAFFIGAGGNSAIYTPSGSTTPGTWTTGPTIPGGLGEDDASAAMLRDGTFLITASPADSYNGPTSLFSYNWTTNSYTAVSGPNTYTGPAFLTRMLALPNGDILYSENGSTLYQYDPGTTALAQAVPTIASVVHNTNGTMTLTGTNLNGINVGATYGDDAQMDTNYPLVRLTSGSNVYYATTSNWSSTGVMLGSTSETVNFTLPLSIPAGTYSLVTVANGVPSTATSLTVSTTAGNVAPTIATAAAVTPATSTTTTAALSVLGADDAGESNLTYTWVDTSAPAGASLAGFSINGTNAAKNTSAIFHQAGTYKFDVVVTDSGGLSVTSGVVTVVVNQSLTSVTVTPSPDNLTVGQTSQLTATGYDQFGNVMAAQPVFTWSVTSGAGTVSPSGIYTTPSSGTLATVRAATGSLSATATIPVVNIPWTSTDIGNVNAPGTAYDSGAVTTLTDTSDDIYYTSDDFHFDYQELAGDVTITAKLTSETSASNYIKAGLMIRNSLSAADAMVMEADPSPGPLFEWRTTSGGSAAQDATSGSTAPYWLRLVRSGNVFTGYSSPDGVTWTETGAQTITMGTDVYVGLALTSHNSSDIATATFTNVSFVNSQTLTSVKVISTPENLTTGQSRQLIAEAYDQNGFPLATQPAFTYALTSGGGTLSSTGLYTSPSTGTLATFTATTGGLSATGTVAVVNSPWTSTDIGNVSAPGTAYDSGTTTTLTDTSDDIWNASDDFHFDYQTLNGNGSITAELNSQTTTGGNFTKAGLMIRNSLAANDSMAMVFDAPAGPPFEYRTAAGANATQIGTTTNYGTPYFFRLTRSGSTISAYSSPNGTAWTLLGSQVIAMNPTVYIGLALTSHSTTVGATAVFSNVTISNPTVATAAAATPNPVTGTTAALSVLGANTPNTAGEPSLSYSWAATTIPAGVTAPTFSANGTNAAKNTTVTSHAAGSYVFTVTISDALGNSVTSAVSVIVNQTLTSIVVSPATASVYENGTQTFTAAGKDQFGTAIGTAPTVAWAVTAGVGSINSAGVYTAPATTGSATIAATSGPVTGTATVTVVSAAPTVATAASASPSPVTGTTTALSVLGTDASGESILTYTWAATTVPTGATTPAFSVNGTNAAKNTTATFFAAGNYAFTVTISDGNGNTVTSSVAVTVNETLSFLLVSPTAPRIHENATQAFTAVGYDQFGSPLPAQPSITWSKTAGIGSIDAVTGVYTAPGSTGNATIQAASGSVVATATVVVTNAAPTVATAAAATPSPVTGSATALSVLGADDGGESNLTYTWAATTKPSGAAAPIFSINGTNAAKNTTATFYAAGSYSFTVTITDGGGLSTTSSVAVTVSQTLTAVALASPSVVAGGTDQASVTDQFGNPFVPAVAYTVNGGGTVSSTGLFTANQSAGTYTVTAVSGTSTETASVTVISTVFTGPAGADTYAIRISPADASLEQIFVNVPEASTPTYTIPTAQLPSLTFDPAGGDGSLTIDFTNGNPLPAGGVSYTGGPNPVSGGNALFVTGTAAGGLGLSIDAGQIIDSAAPSSPVSYSNLQSVEFDLAGGNNTLAQLAQPAAPLTFSAGPGRNTLNVSGGTFTFAADPQTSDGSLTVNDNAAVVFTPAPAGSAVTARHLAALNLGSVATAVVQDPDVSADRLVLVLGGLSLAPTSQLNLSGNDMIVQGGSVSAVTSEIASAYTNGNWTGSGITSSAAAGDTTHLTALGVMQNTTGAAPASPVYPAFDNQPSTTADVLVKYTFSCDANLDGKVDGSDYTLIDNGYASAGALTGWSNGDFNYDGVIDGSDYSLTDNAFNNQPQTLPAAVVTTASAPSETTAPAAAAPAESTAALVPASRFVPPSPAAAAAGAPAFSTTASAADLLELLKRNRHD